jgi:hypothetical protein
MWVIEFSRKKQNKLSSSSCDAFDDDKIVALAMNESDVDAKIDECVFILQQSLRKQYCIRIESEGDPLSVEKTNNHHCVVGLKFANMDNADKYEFAARELSEEDSSTSKIGYNFNIDEIIDILSRMGFEVQALRGKTLSTEDLWPLLFIQYSDKDHWRNVVGDTLSRLSMKVMLTVDSCIGIYIITYYCDSLHIRSPFGALLYLIIASMEAWTTTTILLDSRWIYLLPIRNYATQQNIIEVTVWMKLKRDQSVSQLA